MGLRATRDIVPRRRAGAHGRVLALAALAAGSLAAQGAPLPATGAGVSAAAGAPIAVPHRLSAPVVTSTPGARFVLRAGDETSFGARAPGAFSDRIGLTPGGGIVFIDLDGTGLFLRQGGPRPQPISVLAWAGEPLPGGGEIAAISHAAAAPDGSVYALVGRPDSGTTLLRLPPGGGPPEAILGTFEPIPFADGPTEAELIDGLAVDGAGRVVVRIFGVDLRWALVRLPPGGTPERLISTGDALADGTLDFLLDPPAANASGTIAFSARLDDRTEVMATLSDGSAPAILMSVPPRASNESPAFGEGAPAIDDAGDVAFLWADASGNILHLQRVAGGQSITLASTGDPAPDGSGPMVVFPVPPALDPAGAAIFVATFPEFRHALCRHLDATEALAVEGDPSEDGATFLDLYGNSTGGSPAAAPDGTILFAAPDTLGGALFAVTGASATALVRAGDPVAGVARFASFREPAFAVPYLSAGPFLAPGGRMIFDARLTGGQRGLFLRGPDGSVTSVAFDGDPAPGGGRFDGQFFSFHTVNDSGTVAFIASAPGTEAGSSLFVAYGPADGPLVRVISFGDSVPGSDAVVSGFLPPSRVDAAGDLAIPAFLSDGTVVLLGWDGTSLFRVAGPGDLLPTGRVIESIILGDPGRLLAPLLDDAGQVNFGAVTSGGTAELYEAPLLSGGSAAARRVLGDGDVVPGGVLSPFRLQAFDRDATGRLAYQSISAPGTLYATFLNDGTAPLVVIAPGDPFPAPDPPFPPSTDVSQVLPHLAFAGGGRLVHGFSLGPGDDSTEFLIAREPSPPPAPPGSATSVVLAGPGLPAPGGGTYLMPHGLVGIGGNVPMPQRLASDGVHLVAEVRDTTEVLEGIVQFDLDPDRPPTAAAGPDQTVECAGPDGAPVALDGSASSDPDGDPLEYEWSGFPAPLPPVVAGAQPVVTLPLGSWTLTLTVRDGRGGEATDAVTVTVQDTVPPTIAATAQPNTLWPPNGDLKTVVVSIVTQDLCDPQPIVTLTGITIDDRKGSDPALDIAGASYGTDDRTVALRSTRSGGATGRTYTLFYSSADHSGNAAAASTAVVVPGNRP